MVKHQQAITLLTQFTVLTFFSTLILSWAEKLSFFKSSVNIKSSLFGKVHIIRTMANFFQFHTLTIISFGLFLYFLIYLIYKIIQEFYERFTETSLEGKTVLITGSASGIGKTMALNFYKKEKVRRVIIIDINKTALESFEKELTDQGFEVLSYLCDITNYKQVESIYNDLKSKNVIVDILINNAGIVNGKLFVDLPIEKMELTMKVNTLSNMYFYKLFLKDMIKRKSGHLVAITSSAGIGGVRRLSDYCCSKAASMMLLEAIRFELRRLAPTVKTTIVCPYFVDTGLFSGAKITNILWQNLKTQDVVNDIIESIKRGRTFCYIPGTIQFVYYLRSFINFGLLDWSCEFLGVQDSMNSFHGRQKKDNNNKKKSIKDKKED